MEPCADALCVNGWQPVVLTGFFLDILRKHFHDADSIATNDLRRYVWTKADRTGILIEDVDRWRALDVGKRPAIIVKQNAYRNMSLGLRSGEYHVDMATGARSFVTLWIGSHTLFCLHTNGTAAALLATEVANEVHGFAQLYKEQLNLTMFAVTEVGAISEIEEATETRAVPITVGWAYQQTWKITKAAPPLWQISIDWLCRCK